MLKVPTGLGDAAAPTAMGYTLTIRSFSMSASFRSGMLTTTRRVTATVAARAESAASDGVAHTSATTVAVIVECQLPRLLFIVSSRPRIATAEPTAKSLQMECLDERNAADFVSDGARRGPPDTGGAGVRTAQVARSGRRFAIAYSW